MPRDFTALFLWPLATVGLRGPGFSHHGTQRDSLYGIKPRRESTRLFVGDPSTAVLPGTASSHDGTKRDFMCGIRLPRYRAGFLCIYGIRTPWCSTRFCLLDVAACRVISWHSCVWRPRRWDIPQVLFCIGSDPQGYPVPACCTCGAQNTVFWNVVVVKKARLTFRDCCRACIFYGDTTGTSGGSRHG